jgi:hypothetical protein
LKWWIWALLKDESDSKSLAAERMEREGKHRRIDRAGWWDKPPILLSSAISSGTFGGTTGSDA